MRTFHSFHHLKKLTAPNYRLKRSVAFRDRNFLPPEKQKKKIIKKYHRDDNYYYFDNSVSKWSQTR